MHRRIHVRLQSTDFHEPMDSITKSSLKNPHSKAPCTSGGWRVQQQIANEVIIEKNDARLLLSAARAAFYETDCTLFIADTHFGKATTFRRAGIPVPAGTTSRMLQRISQLLDHYSAKKLCVLGDFIHSQTTGSDDFESELLDWRAERKSLAIELVLGNHDRGRRELFDRLDLQLLTPPFRRKPLELCHYPDEPSVPAGECTVGEFVRLAGHLHPAVRLSDGGSSVRASCFWLHGNTIVLPAFGEFTGTSLVPDDRQAISIVCAEDTLLPLMA